jgi:hypothetical protein
MTVMVVASTMTHPAKHRHEESGQNMEAKKRAKLLKQKPQGSAVTYKELQ